MIQSYYLSSKYYDKYGKIFKDLEYLAYKMGKEWDTYIKMYDEMALVALQYGDLNQKYNDDLQAFALMFRNIDINNCNVVDKAYTNTFLKRTMALLSVNCVWAFSILHITSPMCLKCHIYSEIESLFGLRSEVIF